VDPELELLARWRAGDRLAGEQLFAKHFAEIYRFFEHKVSGDADDLSQRTFLSCIEARDSFRGQSSFRTYLFTIARNALYDHLRRLSSGANLDFEVTSIEAITTSVGRRIDSARQVEQLRAALQELPAEQQILLELHYWHGLEAAQLAEVFDARPGSIRVRLLRARRALRARMLRVAPDAISPTASDRMAASLSESEPADAESEHV
jgi:RNA polymerase sigma factor (sigma-70 family)